MTLTDDAQFTLQRAMCIEYAKGAMLPFARYKKQYDEHVSKFVLEHEHEWSEQAESLLKKLTNENS